MKENKYDLAIIIPGKNEAKRIEGSLDKLASYLKKHDLGRVHVFLIVNNTTDNTVELALNKAKNFDKLDVYDLASTKGKGYAVKVAMHKVEARYKMFMDADMATPLHHLEEFHRYMKGGTDVIIGLRNLTESHKGLRKFISTFGNILVRVFLGLKIKDTQCGFKAFRSEVADDLFGNQRIESWGFDMELLAIAHKRGYSIQTVPIPDWQDVQGGTVSNVATQAALSTFVDLLKIKLNLLTGRYKKKGN